MLRGLRTMGRGRGARVAVAIAALLLGVGGTASALAAGSTQVRVGQPPPLTSAARTVGGLPPAVRIHLTVVLKPRDGLAAYASAVSTPGSSAYHHYLTPAQFASRFGATPAQVAAVDASMRAHGMTPGQVSANRLAVPVIGTAGQVEQGFAVSLRRVALRSGRQAVVANAAPAVDRAIAGDVQDVTGLSSVSAPKPLLVRDSASAAGSTDAARLAPRILGGGPHPSSSCGASSVASSENAYTADQIAAAYRFSDLYAGGAEGQGQTIAVYELESYDRSDIAAYQACYGTDASVNDVPVDGGPGDGGGPGSGEAALDIEQLIGLAPKAKILVYQGPNSGTAVPGSGPYDTLNAIVAQDRAQVVSTSWGDCEPVQGGAALSAEDNLLQEAAIQGQSVLAAAGDNGSEDCTGSNALAVDDPASQQFVTAVGGTTLQATAPLTETVWDQPGTSQSDGAGGGGVSQAWQMPGYQSNASPSLKVIGPFSSGSRCANGGGNCRQVPDVSADADPAHGYVSYWDGGWLAVGGTSASAPLWAALLADANSSAACRGSAIGFANPALYRGAGTAYAGQFNDVTSGNNDFLQAQSGRYPAGVGYDMASGLGTPKAGALAATLCVDALRVDDPGVQLSTVGRPVSLRINTSALPGTQLRFLASQLPPGLSISQTSGRITGSPTRTGTWRTGVAAMDQNLSLRGAFFWWRVVGAPRVSRIALVGVAARHPKLTFTLSAGRAAPPLTAIWIHLPRGLRFGAVAGRVRIVNRAGRRIGFSSRLVGGRLHVLLAAPAWGIRVTLAPGAIRASSGLVTTVRRNHRPTVIITVATRDSAGQAVTSRTRVRASR